jgi:hypothetical protein
MIPSSSEFLRDEPLDRVRIVTVTTGTGMTTSMSATPASNLRGVRQVR